MEEVTLLGSVEITVDGRGVKLGSPKERCVLAVLAVECGRPVTAETLAARIWGTAGRPEHARATLTSYLSRLRRRLRDTGAAVLRHDPAGYVLAVDADAVDLHRFRRLCRQARAIAASGDDEQARDLLREAEGLWRGEPLAGLPGDWARHMRVSLEEEFRATVLERIDTETRLGLHAEVVGELFRLTAAHPFDEKAAGLLMTALYRCDRSADALAVYRRVRTLLAEENGTEPGPGLREIHEGILRRDVGLAATPRREAAPPDSLPPDIDDFTGRDRELDALTGRAHDRVSVITGMAGVGKSALAVRAARALAHRYPDVRLYLHLRGHDPELPPLSPHAALAELLRQLNVPAERVPAGPAERALLWRREMERRRAIVVLDDATGVRQICAILTARSARFLVTARRRLSGLPGAGYLRLDVLGVEAARALVRGMAGHLRDVDVDAIVRRCGRLPVALRVAAGRAAAGLFHEDDADAGTGGGPAEAAFELSYRALTDDQRLVFRRLGLSPCPETDVRTVPVVSGVPAAVARDAVEALLDHHLVQEPGPGRLRMHDLVRAFARSRAFGEESSAERRRAVGRLLNHYLTRADQADRALHPHRHRPVPVTRDGTDEPDARAWLEAEWRNGLVLARHAFAHEWRQHGVLLVRSFSAFLEAQGHYEHAAEAQEEALQAVREFGDGDTTALALRELSQTKARTGHHTEALELAEEALGLTRASGDARGSAEALDRMGIYLWHTARFREALAHHREAQALYRRIGDGRGEAEALGHAGIDLWHLGRYEEAAAHLRAALDGYLLAGDERGAAMAHNNLGEIQRRRGYHRDAVRHYQEAGRVFGGIGEYPAILRNNVGNVHQYKGNYGEALRCHREAIAVFRAAGDRRNVADALNSLGVTYLLIDRPAEALVHHQNAERIAREIEDPYQRVRAVQGIADAHRATGCRTAALDHHRQALAIARSIGDPYHEGKAHEGIAATLLQLRGPDAARIHWRQALDLFERLDVPEARSVAIQLQMMDGVSA
ncbi:AfsR/SARP family transcriptional regulator [Actinomadura monticuli]|uniref:BTAD domain-containing putative transcriptional regulator n=1 Tax=Actinomadura monticuli TaxID=3097367 RepID=A0ABV4QE38_9ACTN